MRKLLLIAALAIFCFTTRAQSANMKDVKETKERLVVDTLRDIRRDTLIFQRAEIEPDFPGGMGAFYKYIANNIKSTGSTGKVFISFLVEKDGSLTRIKIERGLSENADQEAIRLIRQSPKWKPGTLLGRPVRVFYTVPITFK